MSDNFPLRAQGGTFQVFRDQSLLITATDGEVRDDGIEGAYYANTRLLSRLALRVNGRPLTLVQAAPARHDLLVVYYHDPAITDDEEYRDRALLVQMTVAAGAGFHLDLDARNHSLAPIACELALLLAADFADLEEQRQGRRLQHGEVRRRCLLEESSELRYDYLYPGLSEGAVLRFTLSPRCHDDGVRWRLDLPPQSGWHACVAIAPVHQGVAVRPTARCYGASSDTAGESSTWQERATRIETSNESVRRAYTRAVHDLAALALRQGPPAEQPAFAAGIPFYQNPFGRDLLTTSWQALLATPVLLESAILTCERTQGVATDDFRDEQPGRIIQQLRTGPLNLLNINPRGRYYSDYASPADFLIMLGQHLMWTGNRDFFRAHLPAAERVLAWFDDHADLDGDGFYEYQTRSPQGDRNQGWKDSERAIPHADGRDAPLPVAASDVQAYVYAGKQQLSAGLISVGRVRDGLRLLREAAALKRRFNEAFWMPDEGFLALALDGSKRQVRSIASNAGHCLAAAIVESGHAPAVAGRLMAPDMFSGWGVRTLSAEHPAYNPFSYHLGSLWTVEQATIAFGLKRYGFAEHANAIAKGTFDLAERYALNRLPEAVGGLPRDRQHPFPGLYPRSCWPQAWSASAVIMLLQVMLGLRPIAPLGLLLVYPELPEWLPDLTLHNLRIGSSTLSVQFRRGRDGATDYRVLDRHGPVRVLREPLESSVRHGLARRALDPLVAALTGHI